MKELTCASLWLLSKSRVMLGQCLDSVRCFVLYFLKKKKNYFLRDGYLFFPFSTSVCLNPRVHGHIFILRQAGKSGEGLYQPG